MKDYTVRWTEIVDFKAWVKDTEVDNEIEYTKFHKTNTFAISPEEALENVAHMLDFEEKAWYMLSTDVKVKEREYRCHTKFNDELYHKHHK